MYATLSDLVPARVDRAQLIELSNDDSAPVTDEQGNPDLNMPVIDAALADAESRVDGYLSTQVPVPVQPVPPLVTSVTCDIWLYNLYSRKYNVGDEENAGAVAVARRYKDAIRLLEQIAAGKIQFGKQPVESVVVRAPAKAFGERFRREYD